ncbi:hypothetical protein ASF62_14210 [Leifsonia sp. Leaf325]|nr:CARDB domain-containing protein [Leifsonia sp. Leaf325]KQQ92939.1 hypothetical protein ASF62_14210 [Leifsonia sp. Leaf325]
MKRRFRSWVAGLLVAASALALVGLTTSAMGATVAPFGVRFQTNDNGAIAVVGNQLQTCQTSAANCVGARAGTARYNNNSFAMANLDVDSDPSTINSSSAALEAPADGEVLWAGLYWGARLAAGPGGTAATGDRRTMSFKVPGATDYEAVSSQTSFGPTTSADRAYQEFADVTALVRAAGPGDYWGANVRGGTGEDRYAGWSLAVVFRSPELPLRNLTVFDGFADVGQGEPQTVTVSGFLAPLTGPVDTQLGIVGYEGDFSTSGDTVTLNSTQLGTTVSPGTNFFNGSNDRNGASVTARSTADRNMLGFDVKQLGASGVIPNGATSADFRFTSSGDRYFPGVLTTAINLFAPDFTPSSKSVVNLDGNSPARPGDTLQYSVNLTNVGGDPAAQSVASDPLPPGTEYVPGSLQIVAGAGAGAKTDAAGDDQGDYDAASRTVRFRVGDGANATSGGVLDPAESTTVRFDATVTDAAAGTSVTNEAQLDYVAQTVGSPFTYRVRPVSTPVEEVANLAVTKTVAPDPSEAGGPVSFSMLVVNNGPNPARGVVLTDPIPAGITVTGTTATQGSCAADADPVSCELGTLASGASATVVVTGRTDPGSTETSVTDIATVTSTTSDPDLSDNTAGATAQLAQAADLVVTKTAAPTSVVPGGTTAFTVTVTNEGPSTARTVTVNDAVDDTAALALLDAGGPGATCAQPAPAAQCSIGELAPGASVTLTLTGLLTPGTAAGATVTNQATVSSVTPDPVVGNNQATATVTAATPETDVSIAKTGPATVVAGRTLTYSITVSNDGLSDAADVQVSDLLPAGIVASSVATTRGTCTVDASVECSIPTLLAGIGGSPGATAVITIQAVADGDAPIGTATNTATVTSTTTDTDPSNNSASADTEVTGDADLVVTKTATPNPAVAGSPITYTITAANSGPSTSRDIVLDDLLPPEFDFASATPSQGTCDAPVDSALACDIGDIVTGATATLEVVMDIPADYTGTPDAVETVTATSGTSDPDETNNTASWTATTQVSADLSISKQAPATAASGSRFSYTISPRNVGPSSSAETIVTDPLPADVTFVSATDPCTAADDIVTCDLGTLDPGEEPELTVTVQVGGNVNIRTLLSNTATVASSTLDPSEANNSATAVTETTAIVDLSVTKEAFFGSTAPGGQDVFIITLTNAGPSTARAVSFTDTFELSSAAVVLQGGTCEFTSGDLSCTIDGLNLAPGASAQVSIGIITPSSAQPGTYLNTVRASTSTPESDASNNVATFSEAIADPVADLAVAKTLLTDPLVAGGGFSYQLEVSNIRSASAASDASDVVVTDDLPPGLTATSASPSQGSCTVSATQVSCDLGVVPGQVAAEPPPPVTVTISGTVSPGVSGSVGNSAVVESSTPDPDDTNNEVLVTSPVELQADLSITKTADTDPLVAGGTASYTVTVTNSGPSNASNVVLTDVLDGAIAFDADASDAACSLVAGQVTCELDTIGAGQTLTVRISGRLDPASTVTELSNTASVSSDTPDPAPGGETTTITTPVVQNANLRLSKTADSATPSSGSTVTYSIALNNDGPSNAVNTTIVDPLPAGVEFVSLTAFSMDCTASPAPVVVSCTAAGLEAGRTQGVAITVLLPDGSLPGAIENIATAASDTSDADASNNASSALVDLQVVADTAITKTVVTPRPTIGKPVTFRLNAVNNGPATAPAAVFTDTLPGGTTLISAVVEGSSAVCTTVEQEGNIVVNCPVGSLPVGGTSTVLLTVDTSELTTASFSNTGFIGSGALDPNTPDNQATAAVTLLIEEEPPPPTTDPPTTEPPTTAPPTSGTPDPGDPGTPPVAGPSGVDGSGLVSTGVNAASALTLALGLILLGGLGLVLRRRKPSPAD